MGGRQDRDELLGQDRLGREPRLVRRLAHEPDVDHVLMQSGHLRRCGHLADLHVHLGILVAVGAQQARQKSQRERCGEADPDATGLTAAGAPGRVQADGDLVERAPGGGQELVACRGEGDPAGSSGEQRMPDLRFQAADLLAERRLRDAQPLRRTSEVEFLGEHREGVKLLKSELRTVHTCRDIIWFLWRYWTYHCWLPTFRHMAERRVILSGSTFEEEIGYARAVIDGDWVHVSGTTGFDYATMTISGDVVEQAEQCLRNVESALAEAGCSFADVVRVRYLLPDREDFRPCWPTLRRCFGDIRPAATMLVCGLSDSRMKFEIEVYARRPAEPRPAPAAD
jgi:enamine deaminase RidA (YjgF/YER057c/UK114 family)